MFLALLVLGILPDVTTLTLGKDVHAKTVAVAEGKPPCKAAPDLVVAGDAAPVFAAATMTYGVTIENPTGAAVAVCLTHFKVMSAPLVLLQLTADSGLDLPRLPEIYPRAGDKVVYEKVRLPAHTRLLLKTTLNLKRASYADAQNLALAWTITVNGDQHTGKVAVTVPAAP